MRPPSVRLFADEIVVDNFAGGGGASTGIERATDRSPDLAINHNENALSMHQRNHPRTRHLHGDVWDVDPVAVCAGRPVGLAWFSPDCTDFSRAKGKRPRSPRVRALAWVVIRWARTVRPRVIFMENVGEFADWGPLDAEGEPDPAKRGRTFKHWLGKLRGAGYQVEYRELRACDYGAPTIRKRLFLIARCDARPIVWPIPTHGFGGQPHRAAAECIEWALPCPSIFGRKKALAENTLRRIARGVQRFVLESGQPFLIPTTHQGDSRVHSIAEPLRTVTGANRGELALVAPSLIQTGYGERRGQAPRTLDILTPLGTVVGGGQKHGLVSAFLAKHYGHPDRKSGGGAVIGSELRSPIGTVTSTDHHSLVTSHMVKLRGTCPDGQRMDAPAPTITAGGTHLGEVRSFLTRFNGTGGPEPVQLPLGSVTSKPRFGLVRVSGEDYAIADIGFRMLQPRELYRAQSFADSYEIERGHDGRVFTKETQIFLCGNSVPPVMAEALVRANLASREEVAA
ncbi:MAG TPA: DNA cytosine methyltransferase [Polyangiaceae bacterium]|jgi:DNA (cytosine-5)-methyltransferase 1